MQNSDYSKFNNSHRVSLACWTMCGVILLILGFLPALPSELTQVLRPAFILVCLLPAGYYKMKSEKWQLVLLVYWFFILVLNPIKMSTVKSYAALALFGLFFVFAATRVWTKREIKIIFNTVVAVSVFFSLALIYMNDGIIHHEDGMHISFFSFVMNRNTGAFGCVPGALCATVGLFYGKRRFTSKSLYSIAIGICSFTVFALASRSAFVSLAVGIVLIFWQNTNEKPGYQNKFIAKVATIIAVLLAVQIAYLLAQGTSCERLFDFDDDSGRGEMWDKAWVLIDEKPVFGGGFDYWADNSGEYLGTHNTFLSVMVSSGYVGGALLGLFFISIFIEALKVKNWVPLAFLIELLMHSYTESGMDYYAYFPLILAFILIRYLTYQSRDLSTIFN